MFKHRLKPAPAPRTRLRPQGSRAPIARQPATSQPAPSPSRPEAALPAEGRPPEAQTAPYEWLAAFDELDEPVFIHDREFRILRCNPAYAACAGTPMEAIVGRPYWQVFPKLAGPLGNCVEALTKGATAEKSELTAAGGQVFLSHDITAHRASGEFWYSRHLMENMTARRQEEDTGRQKALLADAVVAGLPALLLVVDRQRRLLRWNRQVATLTGLAEARLQGADVMTLVAQADRSSMAAALEQAFDTGHGEGDVRLLDAAGEPRRFVFSAGAVAAGAERCVACVGFGGDLVRRFERGADDEKAFSDAIVESAPGPCYVVDQQYNLVRWNRHLRELTQMSDADLMGTSILSTVHEDDRPLAAAKFLAAVAMGHAQMEVRLPSATRGLRTYMKTARRFELGGVPYVTGFCVDITERKEVENALTREKAFADALVNSVPGAFYVVDMEGNYYAWNSYLNRLTGLSNEELRQRSSLLTIEEPDRPRAAAAMKQAFETGYAQAELHVLTHDRGVRLYFMAARRFSVRDTQYLVGVGVDTTDRGERVRQLEEEARTDPLTHLANRNHFLELATQEFARSRRYGHPLSLWVIDVDHFKAVNDAFGHHAGDIALQSLSSVSRQALRDWDVMGRLGGEEFGVLLPETDATQALLVAERLRQKVAASEIRLDGAGAAHLTISIGVATLQEDDSDIDGLLVRADEALMEAKRTGRDKVATAGVTRG
ncbi:MAG: diguanylate cyclase [Ignavibacteria bacterium]